MNSFKKNLITVYSVNIINGFLSILFVPLCLNLIGAEGYGLLSIYTVLASFIGLTDIGLGRNLQRLLATSQDINRQKAYLQSSFGIYLIQAIILLASLPFLFKYIPEYIFSVSSNNFKELQWIIALAVIEHVIAIPVAMRQNLCIANEQFDRFSTFGVISGVTRYGFMFAGIFIFASPIAVITLIVSRRLVDLYTSTLFMGELPQGSWRPRFVYQEIKAIVRDSLGMSIVQALQSIVIAVGSILVNRHYGLAGLGKYRSAFDLASKVWFFSNGLGLVVFPKFVKRIVNNDGEWFLKVYKFMNISWAGFNLASVSITLVAVLFYGYVGIHDRVIVELFVLLLLGICLNAHANLSYELLQAAAKYRFLAFITSLSLLIMVTSFYGFQQKVGIHAIGLSWIISQAIYSSVSDFVALVVLQSSSSNILKMLISKLFILLSSSSILLIYFKNLPIGLTLLPVVITLSIFIYSILEIRKNVQSYE